VAALYCVTFPLRLFPCPSPFALCKLFLDFVWTASFPNGVCPRWLCSIALLLCHVFCVIDDLQLTPAHMCVSLYTAPSSILQALLQKQRAVAEAAEDEAKEEAFHLNQAQVCGYVI
jgi:hypothetical protein